MDHVSKKSRGFVVLYDAELRAFVLLKSRLNKGSGYQLPGGRCEFTVDAGALTAYVQRLDQKLSFPTKPYSINETEVCRFTAIRELYEETGLDLTSAPHKLLHLSPACQTNSGQLSEGIVPYIHNKHFFFLPISRPRVEDSTTPSYNLEHDLSIMGGDANFIEFSARGCKGSKSPIPIVLSEEHSGYAYVRDASMAASLISKHSGGDCSRVLAAIEPHIAELVSRAGVHRL